MFTVKQLDERKQSELHKINHTGLVDISNIQIDTSIDPEQRMLQYLEQVKNPYLFLCTDTAVRVRFEPTGGDLKD